MDKLDRLGWAASVIFDAYGLRIGVRVNRPEVLDRVRERLPPGWRPSSSAVVDRLYSLRLGQQRGSLRGYHLLYAGVARRARTLDLGEALDALESDLRQTVAAFSRDRVFIHAGVVGWQGGAILVPGRSFSGKTTLVRELVRAGAEYYSDEFAVLDERGRVHPFAMPLSIRDGPVLRRSSAEDLGGICGRAPLPVRAILLTGYRDGARWRPRRLTPVQSLLSLLAHTVPVRRRPRAALRALERVVSTAVVLKGTRGEADVLARALLARFAAQPSLGARAS
jgi:hypothetical protein